MPYTIFVAGSLSLGPCSTTVVADGVELRTQPCLRLLPQVDVDRLVASPPSIVAGFAFGLFLPGTCLFFSRLPICRFAYCEMRVARGL